jgi:hypothetical protein
MGGFGQFVFIAYCCDPKAFNVLDAPGMAVVLFPPPERPANNPDMPDADADTGMDGRIKLEIATKISDK